MRTNALLKLFILVVSLATAAGGQELSRPFSRAKSLPQQPDAMSFEFSISASNYSLSPRGKGVRSSRSTNARPFNLRLDRHDYLVGDLYFAVYQGDLLLIGEASDGDYGSGFIIRLDGRTLRVKWKQVISGFNVGQGLMDDSYAYVTGVGFIGKVSLKSGAYVWRHKDLYQQNNSAFNSFELPEIDGSVVVFKESPIYLRKKVAVVRVDRRNGKKLSIEK